MNVPLEVLKESPDIDEEKKEKAVMPSTELLDRALDDGSSLSESELNQIAELLEAKLEEFGIEATVESVLPGPVVTRFEIQPAPGTKASKITNIAQDIARSLSVSSVRVVEVIEGKSYVGIEIPNNNRKMVRLTEILSSKAFKSSPSNLIEPLCIGTIPWRAFKREDFPAPLAPRTVTISSPPTPKLIVLTAWVRP